MTINDGNQSMSPPLTRHEIKLRHLPSPINKWWNCFLCQLWSVFQNYHRWPGLLTRPLPTTRPPPPKWEKETQNKLWCYLFFLYSACATLNYESGEGGFLHATINRLILLSQYKAHIWDRSLTDGVSPSSAWRPACMQVCVRVCANVCTLAWFF